MSEYHVPVLLKESVDGLDIRQGGVYLDLTFGGGGHSGEILKRLDAEGCLLGFDQDEDALANVPEDDRFIFVNHNFRYLRNFMRYYGYEEADGILADLGVSSHEFDEAGRGFSFRFEAELDMRMNQRSKLTAATVLNTYDAEQLTAIFRNYGEVENARRLVDLIVKARANQEIKTSEAFYQIILPCIPKLKEKKISGKSLSGFTDRSERGAGSFGGDDATGDGGIEAGGQIGDYYLSFSGRSDCEKFFEGRECGR